QDGRPNQAVAHLHIERIGRAPKPVAVGVEEHRRKLEIKLGPEAEDETDRDRDRKRKFGTESSHDNMVRFPARYSTDRLDTCHTSATACRSIARRAWMRKRQVTLAWRPYDRARRPQAQHRGASNGRIPVWVGTTGFVALLIVLLGTSAALRAQSSEWR